jgi:outer membrane cobalamin receptor
MFRKLLVSAAFLIISLTAFAQNGSIGGLVIDAVTKEPVIGASVLIQGTQVGAMTDLEGKFVIANVKPGTYSLSISFITYTTNVVPDVIVEAGKRTDVEVPLQEGSTALEEVVVTGTRTINTDESLISSIKEAKLVVSGISAQQITRLPDRDAAQVAQRIPGITIRDNRFVMVRGVPERYNQVLINDAIAPSTETEKRSFSFDLIPSGSIDQILVYKSGSAELPGDFAGGVIQVITKQANEEDFISFTVNAGYRTGTTFGDFKSTQGSSTDWLGYDNGFRGLPEFFPSKDQLRRLGPNDVLLERAGKSLSNNFALQDKQTPLDMGFTLGFAKNFNLGNVTISNLTNIGYSNSYATYKARFTRYDFNSQSSEIPSVERFAFDDDYYDNEVKVSLVHNWLADLGKGNKIEFKNLAAQIGENRTVLRNGEDFIQRPGQDLSNNAYRYLSRFIYTGQLQGSHNLFSNNLSKLTWVIGYNMIDRNEPDYRRIRRYKAAGVDEPYALILPPGSSLADAGRYFSTLNDEGYSHGLNFEKKFGELSEDKKQPLIKAGYYIDYKERSFDARYVSYSFRALPTSNPEDVEAFIRQPLDRLFASSNIYSQGKNDGLIIAEGSRPTDHYEGTNRLIAGYISGSIPVGKFDIAAGIRVENNVQTLASQTYEGAVDIENPLTYPLPFANIAYNISERSLVRAAYSRTVNRPEFRELAPFLFYAFEYDANFFGNPDLETAVINNFDARWEMYPNPGESISAGAFYKHFKNPIESYSMLVTESQQFSYGNAPEAYSYGVEVEVRKSLASLGVSKFLRNTSLNVNASWIESRVDLGSEATAQQRYRQLQGQSPYVVNLGLYYADEERGFTANLGYNIFGARIFAVGNAVFPTWYEMPRHAMDFQVSKKIGRLFEAKFNIQNLLNSQYNIYQDNNEDGKIEKSLDRPIQQYQNGTQFSLSLTCKVTSNK